MIDPGVERIVADIAAVIAATAALISAVVGLINKGIISEVHVNTNNRLDRMFEMLKEERIVAENDADIARTAAVVASSKATRDVLDAADSAAKHALAARGPLNFKA
jgi:hypothetical protein